MRLKSAIWVAAYVRRCHGDGAFAAVRRRGAEEAGAIFIKLNRLDGTAELFGPAPQSAFDDAHPSDRAFIRSFGEAAVPGDGATTYDAQWGVSARDRTLALLGLATGWAAAPSLSFIQGPAPTPPSRSPRQKDAQNRSRP